MALVGALEVVVCGAGLAGASCAQYLRRRGHRVTLLDPRPPLSATSQHSTECYRDFFVDPKLVPFMSRSVQLIEEMAPEVHLTRRGYCFLSATKEGAQQLERFAETAAGYGAGEVRRHTTLASYQRSPESWQAAPEGFDLLYGSEPIRELFPFVSPCVALLHARRCGWLDSHGLGRALLGDAVVLRGAVEEVEARNGRVSAVKARSGGELLRLPCDAFVNAAGAWMGAVNRVLGAEALPLTNEIHAKVIFNDTKGVIPQTAPFMVWRDKVDMEWDEEMREFLQELDDTAEGGSVNSASWLQVQLGGQHLRPAGNGRVLMLWEHLHRHLPVAEDPEMPMSFLEMYPELCLRGLKDMVPGLGGYLEEGLGRDTLVDGGFYTVTPDGRPLVGPLPTFENAYVCGGMGTYGLMGAPAAGELLAMHVSGEELPSYADACCWPRRAAPHALVDLLDDS